MPNHDRDLCGSLGKAGCKMKKCRLCGKSGQWKTGQGHSASSLGQRLVAEGLAQELQPEQGPADWLQVSQD